LSSASRSCPTRCTIARAVEQPGVWRVELQMVSLEKYPFAEVVAEKTPTAALAASATASSAATRWRRSSGKLAGKGATAKRGKQSARRLLELNPQLKKKRKLPTARSASR
jgi:hypothetical protein